MQIRIVHDSRQPCTPTCNEWIMAEGKIVPGTALVLARALQQLRGRRLPILIDSGGGSVEDAMAMGRAIRARHLDVVVSQSLPDACVGAGCGPAIRDGSLGAQTKGWGSICASACTLVLAAGTKRSAAPWTRVGVHQMVLNGVWVVRQKIFRTCARSINGVAVVTARVLVGEKTISTTPYKAAAPHALYVRVAAYLAEMGIGPGLMPLVLATPSTSIHWLSRDEATSTGLVTDAADGDHLDASVAPRQGPRSPVVRIATSDPEAAMIIERTTLPTTTQGHVVWTLEKSTDPATGTPRTVLGAAIDIPKAQVRLVMRIFPDDDDAPGTGLVVDMSFKTTNGPIQKILRIGPPQARSDDPKQARAFAYLVESSDPTTYRARIPGSVDASPDIARMIAARWIAVPVITDRFRFFDLQFEHGLSAMPILKEALAAWNIEPPRDRQTHTVVAPMVAAPRDVGRPL